MRLLASMIDESWKSSSGFCSSYFISACSMNCWKASSSFSFCNSWIKSSSLLNKLRFVLMRASVSYSMIARKVKRRSSKLPLLSWVGLSSKTYLIRVRRTWMAQVALKCGVISSSNKFSSIVILHVLGEVTLVLSIYSALCIVCSLQAFLLTKRSR